MLQGVCGFCAWELDIAFLLRELHQLAAGRASRVKESVCGSEHMGLGDFKSRSRMMVYNISIRVGKSLSILGFYKGVVIMAFAHQFNKQKAENALPPNAYFQRYQPLMQMRLVPCPLYSA